MIESADGRSLGGLRTAGDPQVPDVVFAAGTRFRVTKVRPARRGQPAVVSLTELRLAPAVMAAVPVPGLFVVGLDHGVLYHRDGGHAVITDPDRLPDQLRDLGWHGDGERSRRSGEEADRPLARAGDQDIIRIAARL